MIESGRFKIDGNTVWFLTNSGKKVEFKVYIHGINLFEDAVREYLCSDLNNLDSENILERISCIVAPSDLDDAKKNIDGGTQNVQRQSDERQ